MITKIELNNFKCYKHRPFNNLGHLTVFCGNNSVGKSTAIQALAIPFQSRFNEEVRLNGNLVELGSVREIYSAHATEEDNSLNIAFNFGESKCSWGFVDAVEQAALKNHLLNKCMESKASDLSHHYFVDKGFQFLQAERFGPRAYLENSHDQSIRYWLGAKGEHAYEILTDLTNNGERLESGDKRILKADEGRSVRRNIINWMAEISPGFNFESDTVNNAEISHAQFQAYGSAKTNPVNMGFGLSYSLGIVCALLLTKPGGLVVIENPEAHLHPRGQSYIGRLIARAALAGVQVIIETHSDHLLNGIRVGARLDDDYEGEDFKVFYVSGVPNAESTVDEITIGINGELSSWPKVFLISKHTILRH
ncbi:AAA family ATPase [Vibrio alginolyticus]